MQQNHDETKRSAASRSISFSRYDGDKTAYMGTRRYAAPEHFPGQTLRLRSDLWVLRVHGVGTCTWLATSGAGRPVRDGRGCPALAGQASQGGAAEANRPSPDRPGPPAVGTAVPMPAIGTRGIVIDATAAYQASQAGRVMVEDALAREHHWVALVAARDARGFWKRCGFRRLHLRASGKLRPDEGAWLREGQVQARHGAFQKAIRRAATAHKQQLQGGVAQWQWCDGVCA
ncbi:unnamed protein product [Symbiodinium sp. CCMP2592]|nr:unnamed protein product [Symbiodinium sp. CCMP2592]